MNNQNNDIVEYCTKISLEESEYCQEIRKRAGEKFSDRAGMISGSLENALLKFLITMLKPKRVLEIGTFVGYSALSMAEAMPEGSKITTLDINDDYVGQAKEVWAHSPHGKKIESVMGEAIDYLKESSETFDLVFIDADKENYMNYFNLALYRLSPGGVIAIDNALWSGRVLEKDPQSESTRVIKTLNQLINERDDLVNVLLPVRDGIHLVTRK